MNALSNAANDRGGTSDGSAADAAGALEWGEAVVAVAEAEAEDGESGSDEPIIAADSTGKPWPALHPPPTPIPAPTACAALRCNAVSPAALGGGCEWGLSLDWDWSLDWSV